MSSAARRQLGPQDQTPGSWAANAGTNIEEKIEMWLDLMSIPDGMQWYSDGNAVYVSYDDGETWQLYMIFPK